MVFNHGCTFSSLGVSFNVCVCVYILLTMNPFNSLNIFQINNTRATFLNSSEGDWASVFFKSSPFVDVVEEPVLDDSTY